MKNNDNRLDQLFAQVNSQEPQVTFNETKKRLEMALATGLFAAIIAKWISLSTKLKFIIMLSSISIISLSTLLLVSNVDTQSKELVPQQNNQTATDADNNFNLSSENGVIKTVYLDEDDLVIRTTIDSSLKLIMKESIEPLVIKDLTQIPISLSMEKTPDNSAVNSSVILNDSDTIRFTITESTTSAELESIQSAALSAGVKFSFDAKFRSNQIKRMKLDMAIKGRGRSKSQSTFSSGNGCTFSYTLGWILDEKGKAVKFCKSKINNGITSCN